MNIPKTLKVGGKRYKVVKTDSLFLGSANASAEILYDELEIRIVPQAKQKEEADFLHEMMHAILFSLGYREHDEKKVEELAEMLYQIIEDNPEMFEKQEVQNGSMRDKET